MSGAVTVEVPDAQAMRELGFRLAAVLRAGDLVLLRGPLGSGKTTLAQGLGEGLGVRGPVTSPTFVIARHHPSLSGGPPLLHADAYRLGSWAELEDLDLEAALHEAVTVVEWGEGFVEGLAADRLEIEISRADHARSVRHADDTPDVRTVTISAVGQRWQQAEVTWSQLARRSGVPPEERPRDHAPAGGRDDGGMTEYRASFDADVTFLNGGGLQVQGFRLDIPDKETTPEAVGELLVEHLGLLMVDRVRIDHLEIIAEPHKGSRGGPSAPATPGAAPSRPVELNHVIEDRMTTYPGLPGPEITEHLTRERSREVYEPGTEFAINRISMVGNTGTYLDSPYHRYADGADLSGVPLASVADLPAVVVRLADSTARGIGPEALAPYDVSGAAVLLHTGWDRHWRTDAYGKDAPYLTEPAARRLVEAGARLVGIDSVNIDDTADGRRPAHSVLLAAGIPVLEHLTGLDQLPVTGARLHAAPPRIRAFGTFPVRTYALLPEEPH